MFTTSTVETNDNAANDLTSIENWKNTEERHQMFHLQTIKEPLLKLALFHRYQLQLFERRPQHQSHKELFQRITPDLEITVLWI